MLKTIKAKLLFWFLVLSVVPLVALTYYSTMTFQKNLTQETEESPEHHGIHRLSHRCLDSRED